MSDLDPTDDRHLLRPAADPQRDAASFDAPLTAAEIEDVLSNPAMTIEEKQERLAAFAGRMDEGGAGERGSEFEPLEMKIRDALSMLADGGHAYGAVETAPGVDDPHADPRLPGGERFDSF